MLSDIPLSGKKPQDIQVIRLPRNKWDENVWEKIRVHVSKVNMPWPRD